MKLTKYSQPKHGMKVTCKIRGKKIEDAKISIDSIGNVYICQNVCGLIRRSYVDQLGYSYSWHLTSGKVWSADVEDLETTEPPKKRRGPKSYRIVVWDERDGDPVRVFEHADEAEEFVKELIKREEVIIDSIRVYPAKKPFKVEVTHELV